MTTSITENIYAMSYCYIEMLSHEQFIFRHFFVLDNSSETKKKSCDKDFSTCDHQLRHR